MTRPAPTQYVLVYTERSDDGPSLIGPFPSREAALAHADTIYVDYSESHVEELTAPAGSSSGES